MQAKLNMFIQMKSIPAKHVCSVANYYEPFIPHKTKGPQKKLSACNLTKNMGFSS